MQGAVIRIQFAQITPQQQKPHLGCIVNIPVGFISCEIFDFGGVFPTIFCTEQHKQPHNFYV